MIRGWGRCGWVQGYLAHETPPPHRTLQWPYAQRPMVIQGGVGVPYERGPPVNFAERCPYRMASHHHRTATDHNGDISCFSQKRWYVDYGQDCFGVKSFLSTQYRVAVCSRGAERGRLPGRDGANGWSSSETASSEKGIPTKKSCQVNQVNAMIWPSLYDVWQFLSKAGGAGGDRSQRRGGRAGRS